MGKGAGGGRPKGGVRAAARERGVPLSTVQRAIEASTAATKIAGLSDDAVRVAEELGLANNRKALELAAVQSPTVQVQALQSYAAGQKLRKENRYSSVPSDKQAVEQRETTAKNFYLWLLEAKQRRTILAAIDIVLRIRDLDLPTLFKIVKEFGPEEAERLSAGRILNVSAPATVAAAAAPKPRAVRRPSDYPPAWRI